MEDISTFIKKECLATTTADPIQLLLHLMQKEQIRMHGPEHHVLDGSCFLAALHNAGVPFDLEAALDEMAERGKNMPGATCGKWGVCGSAASLGAALSVLHGTGPLSNDRYYKDHLRFVSQVLGKMAEIGGPRCCKRNAFLTVLTAVDFVRQTYGIHLPVQEFSCPFSGRNAQCIGNRCPFSVCG